MQQYTNLDRVRDLMTAKEKKAHVFINVTIGQFHFPFLLASFPPNAVAVPHTRGSACGLRHTNYHFRMHKAFGIKLSGLCLKG